MEVELSYWQLAQDRAPLEFKNRKKIVSSTKEIRFFKLPGNGNRPLQPTLIFLPIWPGLKRKLGLEAGVKALLQNIPETGNFKKVR